MPIKENEDSEYRDIAGAENNHQNRYLIAVFNHLFNRTVRESDYTIASGEQVDHQGEDKLQRIDVEEDDEQQDTVEQHCDVVLQAVAPKELVLIEPDDKEQGEGNREGAETSHRVHQLTERPGHFQRDHQQGHGKCEHRITQTLNARDLMAAPAKLLVIANAFVDQFFSNHVGLIAGQRKAMP